MGNKTSQNAKPFDYGKVKEIKCSERIASNDSIYNLNYEGLIFTVITIIGDNNKICINGNVTVIFEGGNNNIIDLHSHGNIIFEKASNSNTVNVYDSDYFNDITYNKQTNVVNFMKSKSLYSKIMATIGY